MGHTRIAFHNKQSSRISEHNEEKIPKNNLQDVVDLAEIENNIYIFEMEENNKEHEVHLDADAI